MFLTATNLFFYLRDAGLCSAQDVVDERFSISEAGRRNRNYSVMRGTGRSLFVKQIPMVHPEVVAALRREAACGQLAVGPDGRRAGVLSRAMPRLLHYDPMRHVLVYRHLDEAENLSQLCARTGALSPRVASLFGETLGRCHAETARPGSLLEVAGAFKAEPPWVTDILRRPDSVMPGMNAGRRALVQDLARRADIVALLTEVHDGWVRLCLAHGDIKFDNVLLAGPADAPSLFLIDWELADVGDPLWDVASVLVSLVQPWLIGGQIAGEPADLRTAAAPVGAAARAFWTAYRAETGALLAHDATDALRLARLVAVRFVLLAFELLPENVTASPHIDGVIGLARYCIADPRDALAALFGLALRSGPAPRPLRAPTLRVAS